MSHQKNDYKELKTAVGLFFITIVFLLFGANLYMLFFADTTHSYSLTQNYEYYANLDNWNSPVYADGLFDGDAEKDLVFLNGCVYLTQAAEQTFLHSADCPPMNPNYREVADQQPLIGGQRAFKDFSEHRPVVNVTQSFLTHKAGENWKVYQQADGGVTVAEISPDGRVVFIPASWRDKVDAAWYLVSHVFTVIIH